MEIEFWHEGVLGHVLVSCVPNDDPGAFGKDEHARGFPVCTATIDYPGRGYRGFFGWVQRVRSTDNTFGRRAFEMDPARFFEDSPAPYCWYGFKPSFSTPVSRSQPATRLAGSQLPGLHASWRRRPEANRSSAGLLLGLRD
jgi:hypothetical protein